jgi:hypothetical protein
MVEISLVFLMGTMAGRAGIRAITLNYPATFKEGLDVVSLSLFYP